MINQQFFPLNAILGHQKDPPERKISKRKCNALSLQSVCLYLFMFCDTAYRQLLWIQRKIKRTKKTKTEPEKKAKPNPNLVQEKAKIKQKKKQLQEKQPEKKAKKTQKKAKKKQKEQKKARQKTTKNPESWVLILYHGSILTIINAEIFLCVQFSSNSPPTKRSLSWILCVWHSELGNTWCG